MKLHRDVYTLSTGRQFSANRGLLSPGDGGELYEGYDGAILIGDNEDDGGDPPFTPAERKEIAEYMIARWSEWAAIP